VQKAVVYLKKMLNYFASSYFVPFRKPTSC